MSCKRINSQNGQLWMTSNACICFLIYFDPFLSLFSENKNMMSHHLKHTASLLVFMSNIFVIVDDYVSTLFSKNNKYHLFKECKQIWVTAKTNRIDVIQQILSPACDSYSPFSGPLKKTSSFLSLLWVINVTPATV